MVDVLPDHAAADQEGEGPKARLVEHRISMRHLAVWRKRVGKLVDEIAHHYSTTIMADLHDAPAYRKHQDKRERASAEKAAFVEEVQRDHVDPLLERLDNPRPLVNRICANGTDFLAPLTKEL